MVKQYAPIFKAKAGEFKAVRELSPGARSRIAPMFDFDLPDPNKGITRVAHISKTAGALKKCDPPDLFFADAFNWEADAQVETGDHVITFMMSMLRAEGLSPIPTVGYDRWGSPEYRLAVSNVGSGPSGMWALRLDRTVLDDIYDAAEVRRNVEDILTSVGAAPGEVVVFIDLEDVSASHVSVANLVSECKQVLAAISNMNFRAFVIAGSSLPSQINLAVPTPNSTSSLPRKEQIVWRALRAQHPDLPVICGDYGVRGPTSYSGPNKHMNGKIRYSSDQTFFIARGHSINLDGSYVQMHALAAAVRSSIHYRGPAHSWGDQKIAEAAAGLFTGQMTSWIAIDTNHHIHSVVDEVVSYELSVGQLTQPAF